MNRFPNSIVEPSPLTEATAHQFLRLGFLLALFVGDAISSRDLVEGAPLGLGPPGVFKGFPAGALRVVPCRSPFPVSL